MVWVERQLRAATTRFLPVWQSQVLVTRGAAPTLAWVGPEMAADDLRRAEAAILLGADDEHTYVTYGLPDDDGSAPVRLARVGTFRPLRSVGAQLDEEAAALLAYAKGMVHYHEHHRFCGRCGAPTESRDGGHLRVCTDPACGLQDFPRTDPAIIVLVRSGPRCLLGRQPTWPQSRYSIIAGFVEPGENLEAAVVREVREETGVVVEQVEYHSSQPWPFPRSLMIGFTASARETTIRLVDGELEDARWLSRQEIVDELREGTIQLPPPISVSYRLIAAWFDAGSILPLEEFLGTG